MLKALFIFLFTEPYYSSLFHLGERAKLTTSSVPRDWIQMDEVLRRFSVHNKIQATVLKQQRVWSGFHRLAMAVPRTASCNFPILLQHDVYRAVWIIYSHCRPDWDDHHLTTLKRGMQLLSSTMSKLPVPSHPHTDQLFPAHPP